MAIKPGGKTPTPQTEPFWKFFLEPAKGGTSEEVKDGDKQRVQLMDNILSLESALPDQALKESTDFVKTLALSQTATALFERLKAMQPPHRLVLCKAAAEWVVARYLRQRESYDERRQIWQNEKADWEKENPELTENIRDKFNDIFKNLRKDDKDEAMAVRRKNPRICLRNDMKDAHDNCGYAGEWLGIVRHGPMCVKYHNDFVPPSMKKSSDNNKRKHLALKIELFLQFWAEADANIKNRKKSHDGKRLIAFELLAQKIREKKVANFKEGNAALKRKGKPEKKPLPPEILKKLVQEDTEGFKNDYASYLDVLNLREETLLAKFKAAGNTLPHCATKDGPLIGPRTKDFPDGSPIKECRSNPHTGNCDKYKLALADKKDLQEHDELYREWRKDFLAGPKKPVFKYPSAKTLPMPKIFGDGFWQADFEKSVIKLQLETGDWLKFGFDPWPRKYDPSRSEAPEQITSVQVSFLGNRARVGFRFNVDHKQSRIAATQSELDHLRSHDFPRSSNDEPYLAAVLKLVTDNFDGDADKELRVLNVDLGSSEAAWALTVGHDFNGKFDDSNSGGLPIVKVLSNKLLKSFPKGKDALKPEKGLNDKHVLRHQEYAAEQAQKIVLYRQDQAEQKAEREGAAAKEPLKATAFDSDNRSLFIHINRMVRDWVRLNVSQIFKVAERLDVDVIIVDGSRKFMVPGYHKADDNALFEKQRKGYRAFGQIRHKLREKAVEKGMRIVTVPEEGTSSVCYSCGHAQENIKLMGSNKKKREFICESCKLRTNSDLNAALVLGRVFWGDWQPYKEKEKARKKQ